jgi:hypothetical protein
MNASCTTESGYSYAHHNYLQAIINVQLRQSLSRFICSNHRLEVECGKHAKHESVPRRDRVRRLCPLRAVEDEDHLLLVCPAHHDIRVRRLCPLRAVEDEDHLLLVCPAHHDIRRKFGQQLGKQLTPCTLLLELMHSAN